MGLLEISQLRVGSYRGIMRVRERAAKLDTPVLWRHLSVKVYKQNMLVFQSHTATAA